MTDAMKFSRRAFGLGALGTAAAATLTACSGGGEGGGGEGGGGGGVSAYSNKGMDFFFFVVLAEAIKRRSEDLGYSYNSTDAKHDASEQFNQAKTLLVQKPALLTINAVDSGAWAPIAEEARNAGIPIGGVDSLITDGEVDFQVAFDNYLGGKMAAEKTVELLIEKYGEPRGIVFNGYGALSSAAWTARMEAFDDVMKEYPDIEYVPRPTDGSETKAREVAGATLAEFPELDAVHGPSDSITRGFITAMETAGRLHKVGEEGHIILTSIDGEPQAFNWIREGIADSLVSQDPVAYGEINIDMLSEYTANGEDIPLGEYVNEDYFWEKAVVEETENGPLMTIPPYYIDNDNVDDPRQWANVVTEKWGMEQ